jgi:hypothetical protein
MRKVGQERCGPSARGNEKAVDGGFEQISRVPVRFGFLEVMNETPVGGLQRWSVDRGDKREPCGEKVKNPSVSCGNGTEM